MKVKAGEYGFLKKQKRNYIAKMILSILMGGVLFGIGLLVTKGDYKNIGTVLAVLMALPLGKSVTEFIVIFPYKDVTQQLYGKVKAQCKEQAKLMTGMVITSEAKVMNLDFLVECEGNVIALAGQKEQDISYINEYLAKGVRNWGFAYRVKVFKEEKAFFNALASLKPIEVTEVEREQVLRYLESLIVK